jgi:tetratricopeptide (TPR) repeat protein
MGWLADGRPYYTMKLVEGDTLADRLKPGSDVTSQRMYLLQVFARVCQALAFAHSKGVIHRDLKPIHVMVGEHGEVHIIDWGLAKVLGQGDVLAPAESSPWPSPTASMDGQAMGTWPYMPREQANGRIQKMDRRSDVFGLGGILCAILTGKPPYVGPTPEDVKRQASEADLAGAYARLEACGADAELIALARDCLSAEPNGRPPDASVVEKRLTNYLASVEERLRQAELARGVAEKMAEAEGRLRRLAEEKAEGERRERELAEEARRLAEGKARAERDRLAAEEARQAEKRQNAIDKALTAAMGGDLEAAEQAIAEAEGAGASTGQVQMLRGQIALHRGQSREARRHLEEAVRLLPDSVAAWGMLAAAYASDGQWDWYDMTIRGMKKLSPSTPEDFLFKGYAEAWLDPELGLQTIKQAFDRRPMMGIALLLRAEVRGFVAQDTDDLAEAEGAVQDASYARELLRNNPAALWVSLNAHLVKAGLHEHRDEPEQRSAELKLAGKCADALKPFTALPEAVVYRWLYFREMGQDEEVRLRRSGRSRADEVTIPILPCRSLRFARGEASLRGPRPARFGRRPVPGLPSVLAVAVAAEVVAARHDHGLGDPEDDAGVDGSSNTPSPSAGPA